MKRITKKLIEILAGKEPIILNCRIEAPSISIEFKLGGEGLIKKNEFVNSQPNTIITNKQLG